MIFFKYEDWSFRFDEFVHLHKDIIFSWGDWDCIKFSDAMVKAITGKNLLPKSWTWTNEKEALKAIHKYGKGKGLAAAIDGRVKEVQGIECIDPMYMSKGDFLVYKEETELTGIFDGYKILCPNSEDGMITKDPSSVEIIKVWRIHG